jgi:uncharacterized membrane-anchored protein YhcB (DUF1043 family)
MTYGFNWAYSSWVGFVIALVVGNAITTLGLTIDFTDAKCRMKMTVE